LEKGKLIPCIICGKIVRDFLVFILFYLFFSGRGNFPPRKYISPGKSKMVEGT
jgi:hypothetical protein